MEVLSFETLNSERSYRPCVEEMTVIFECFCILTATHLGQASRQFLQRCSNLHAVQYCAILRATTNPHDRRGSTIWLEGEKAGESRFFRIWSMEYAGTA